MKKLLLLSLIFITVSMFAQENEAKNESLAKPSNGKCMVYFARRESGAFLIKFGIYDKDLFLGKLGVNKYFAYECNPGEHVFIGKGENTYYLDANLEEGKTYVIDLKMKMGIMTARISLEPLDKSNKKYEKERKKFLEFIGNKKGELLKTDPAEADDNKEDAVADDTGVSKRMKKFLEMKESGKKITTITPDMYFE